MKATNDFREGHGTISESGVCGEMLCVPNASQMRVKLRAPSWYPI